MVDVIKVLSVLWFIRTIKFVLFWIYLWQLKNYHVGRFVDHFRTHQGKKLLVSPLLLAKIILLPLLFINALFVYVLLAIYIGESALFAYNIFKKNVRKPVFTLKAIILVVISLVAAGIVALLVKAPVLLAADILLPILISFIVLTVQPFFVSARNKILQQAKQKMTGFKNVTVIAITGSYGKTSTKEFLTTILSAKFNVLSTPEHKNSEIGIAKTILDDLEQKHEMFIVEMGAYNKGGIKLLCDMVKPNIGIVTGVNQQHLATFGSLENLLSAEGGQELAAAMPNNGMLIVNGDNKYCLDLYKKFSGNKKVYATSKEIIHSDIWTEDIKMQKDTVSFIARLRDGHVFHVEANVLGKQNVQNLLAAMLAASQLGMDFEQIIQACKNISPIHAGMTVKKGKYDIDIIDSSYSSNPDGVMADLDYLRIFSGKKVVVMPCIIELGSASVRVHEKIGKKIAKVCDLAIITTRDKFNEIKKGATENGMDSKNIIFCDNPKEIFSIITTFCKEGDAVLLEGRVPGYLIKLLHG